MKSELDSASIEIPCPHCGKKLSERIGKLKTNPDLTCPSCGNGFHVDATSFTREFKKVEKSLAELRKTLGKFGQ